MQAVRVVDAKAVHEAVADQSEQHLVGRIEDCRLLDPDGDQGRDVEEASVVQLLRARTPVSRR